MNIITGVNMFKQEHDLYLVTTNSFIKKDGSLVMGMGAAKELAYIDPSLPKVFGTYINHLQEYNVIVLPQRTYGIFQVKYAWFDNANLDLIEASTNMLKWFARAYKGSIALNFPGIGNGRLDETEVLPIISFLPDNVTIYKL